MEKEQSYKDAATNYENAWKYTTESSPAIGMSACLFVWFNNNFVSIIHIFLFRNNLLKRSNV